MTELYKADDAASWADYQANNPKPTDPDEIARWMARYYNKIGANGGSIPQMALTNPYVHVWIGGDTADTINPPRYGCRAEATYQKYGTVNPTDDQINDGGRTNTTGHGTTINGFYPPEGWEAFRLKHDPLLAEPVRPPAEPAPVAQPQAEDSFFFPEVELPLPTNVTVVQSAAETPPPLDAKPSLWDRIVAFFKGLLRR